jgi:hypothetical protein
VRRPILAIVAIVLASLVLTACGSSAGLSPPSGSPLPVPGTVRVTRADDRGIVHVRVGDRVQIALGTEFEWRLDPPDGIVLVHGVQNYLLVRGTQAIWTVAAAGSSTISATGTVICPSGMACIQVALLFTTTVIAEP